MDSFCSLCVSPPPGALTHEFYSWGNPLVLAKGKLSDLYREEQGAALHRCMTLPGRGGGKKYSLGEEEEQQRVSEAGRERDPYYLYYHLSFRERLT